ncbi:ribonuclease H-like domain-containing protein [Tanacetum coccineum]
MTKSSTNELFTPYKGTERGFDHLGDTQTLSLDELRSPDFILFLTKNNSEEELVRHKFHANGSLSRYKAQLVANGSSQQLGIDCDETFSPIVKPGTIPTVLSLALTIHWPVHQLDIKNAFLNGEQSETVNMH